MKCRGVLLFQKFKSLEIFDLVPPGKIVVAVSGGADSVALLHLLWRLSGEKKWDIAASHIQHHLRGRESLRDQKFVESLSKKLCVPLHVRSINIKKFRLSARKNVSAGLEESARLLRYGALARVAWEVGAHTVLTAHHLNDHAETFLMNVLRGSGTDGLCGIFPVKSLGRITGNRQHENIRLARPLLSFKREEILDYLRYHKLSYCRDSTNRLLKFRRNWVRHKLLPLLEKVQPQIVQRIADLTALLKNEKEFWDLEIGTMRAEVLKPAGNGEGPSLDLMRFFRYHISLRYRFIHHIFPKASFRTIKKIHDFLDRKRGAPRADVPLGGLGACVNLPSLRPRSPKPFNLNMPGITVSREWNIKVTAELIEGRRGRGHKNFRTLAAGVRFNEKPSAVQSAYFGLDKILNGNGAPQWKIRSWKEGDRFRPFGMEGWKKLQDYFVDEKVPFNMRGQVPLLDAGNRIFWVIGHRTSEDGRVGAGTKRLLHLKVEPVA